MNACGVWLVMFQEHLSGKSARPSGAKARIFPALIGTAEAVPYPKPIFEARSSHGGNRRGSRPDPLR